MRASTKTDRTAVPMIGVVGSGLPPVLVAAAGCLLSDVDQLDAPRSPSSVVQGLVEPFVDRRVQRLLTQLAGGVFSELSALVFCRDDPVGHIGYIYANEMRRQGLLPDPPPFFLWNLLHRPEPPAQAFNMVQASKLQAFLISVGGRRWSAPSLAEALEAEALRTAALSRITAAQRAHPPRITGFEAYELRRLGGVLTPAEHIARIDAALAEAAKALPRTGPRFGIVGSPCPDVALRAVLDRIGTVVMDHTAVGRQAPIPIEREPQDADMLARILATETGDMRAARALPVAKHRAAIVAACVEARCDVVAIQFDSNDDFAGWDAPSIRAALQDSGIAVFELGFLEFGQDQMAERVAALMRDHGLTEAAR